MASHNEKKQTMLTSIFKTITQEDREVVLAKEIEVLNEATGMRHQICNKFKGIKFLVSVKS